MDKSFEIIQFIESFFNLSAGKISKDTVALDITGWDSLKHTDLLLAIEEKFNLQFELHEMISMDNVGDICTIVNTK